MISFRMLFGIFLVLFGMTSFGEVERVDYAGSGSNVHQRQLAGENKCFSISGTSVFAFGVAPKLEWPSADYEIKGLRLNVFGGEHVDVYGLDVGVFGNFVKREIGGVQLAGVFNVAGESDFALQMCSLCNYCSGDFGGVQIGAVNTVEKGRGLQVGVVNCANILYGVQIGVLNYNAASSLAFMPFVNCAF